MLPTGSRLPSRQNASCTLSLANNSGNASRDRLLDECDAAQARRAVVLGILQQQIGHQQRHHRDRHARHGIQRGQRAFRCLRGEAWPRTTRPVKPISCSMRAVLSTPRASARVPRRRADRRRGRVPAHRPADAAARPDSSVSNGRRRPARRRDPMPGCAAARSAPARDRRRMRAGTARPSPAQRSRPIRPSMRRRPARRRALRPAATN